MSDQILKRIGENLRMLRKRRGWSQQRLADEAGIVRRYLPELESGRKNVSALTLEKLAGALQVPLKEIMEDVPIPALKSVDLRAAVKSKTARIVRDGSLRQLQRLNTFIDEIL
jgi:transcriptional regulator with XRE-family HTH domain